MKIYENQEKTDFSTIFYVINRECNNRISSRPVVNPLGHQAHRFTGPRLCGQTASQPLPNNRTDVITMSM